MIRTMPHKITPARSAKVAALLQAPMVPLGQCPYPSSPLPRPASVHMLDPTPPRVLPRRDYHA